MSLPRIRLYELQKYDVFSIDLNTFMKSSVYWSKMFQIQKFETKWYKKKILFFKIPWKKYIMVQLMYIGNNNKENWNSVNTDIYKEINNE